MGFCFDETTMGDTANTDVDVCGNGQLLQGTAARAHSTAWTCIEYRARGFMLLRERRTLCWLGMRIESMVNAVPVAAVGSLGKMAKLLPLM
jgi:hypothetical protein